MENIYNDIMSACLGRQTRQWQTQLMLVINKIYLIAIPNDKV